MFENHISEDAERRVNLNHRLHNLENSVGNVQKTIDGHISDETDDVKKLMRVMFGDKETGEIGLLLMVKDIHTKIVKVDGVWGFMKLLLLVGGVTGMLYTFFRKF